MEAAQNHNWTEKPWMSPTFWATPYWNGAATTATKPDKARDKADHQSNMDCILLATIESFVRQQHNHGHSQANMNHHAH